MLRVTRSLIYLFPVLGVLCLACGPDPSRPSAASPTPVPVATSQPVSKGADDPELPDMLSLQRDPSDSNRLLVTFIPTIGGHARLTLAGIYNGTESSELELKQIDVNKGDAPQTMTFSIALLKIARDENPDTVRVGLVLTDQQGQTLITTQEELVLTPPAAAKPAVATTGTTSDGQPLIGYQPASAPAPQVGTLPHE